MKKLSLKNSMALLLIVLIICVTFLGGCGSEIDKDNNVSGDDNISVNGDKNINTGNTAAGEIPIAISENGDNPIKPVAAISGTESLYENSYIIMNPDDYECIVNKTYNLTSEYEPDDLVLVEIPFAEGRVDEVKRMRKVASDALTELYNAALEDGYNIYPASGYRSYKTQNALFKNKIAEKGGISEANVYSALPGQSEHQLGLAMDFTLESLGYKLNYSFGETEEGKWLADNCYRFGFIIRYPKDKEEITGYGYEPWHCRYVGKKLAKYLYENGLTLEEYYGI